MASGRGGAVGGRVAAHRGGGGGEVAKPRWTRYPTAARLLAGARRGCKPTPTPLQMCHTCIEFLTKWGQSLGNRIHGKSGAFDQSPAFVPKATRRRRQRRFAAITGQPRVGLFGAVGVARPSPRGLGAPRRRRARGGSWRSTRWRRLAAASSPLSSGMPPFAATPPPTPSARLCLVGGQGGGGLGGSRGAAAPSAASPVGPAAGAGGERPRHRSARRCD